jgi:hypothetical protein
MYGPRWLGLAEHIGKRCFVYLDDIIVYAESFEELLENINSVFGSIRPHASTSQMHVRSQTAHIHGTRGRRRRNPSRPKVSGECDKVSKASQQDPGAVIFGRGLAGFYRTRQVPFLSGYRPPGPEVVDDDP